MIVTGLLGVLVYGSGHDWKSSTFLFLPYLPMYAVLWCLCYMILGLALGLAGRRLHVRSPWLLWLLIPAVGLVPRLRPATGAILHWEYYSFRLIPWGIGYASFLAFAFLGYALSRRITLSSRTTSFAVAAIVVTLLLTDSAVVVNFLSTRGTYLRFHGQWNDWRQGQSLPSRWETAEKNGTRFIVRDRFMDLCHGYFHLSGAGDIPKISPWGLIRDTRKLPGGWHEFLSGN